MQPAWTLCSAAVTSGLQEIFLRWEQRFETLQPRLTLHSLAGFKLSPPLPHLPSARVIGTGHLLLAEILFLIIYI